MAVGYRRGLQGNPIGLSNYPGRPAEMAPTTLPSLAYGANPSSLSSVAAQANQPGPYYLVGNEQYTWPATNSAGWPLTPVGATSPLQNWTDYGVWYDAANNLYYYGNPGSDGAAGVGSAATGGVSGGVSGGVAGVDGGAGMGGAGPGGAGPGGAAPGSPGPSGGFGPSAGIAGVVGEGFGASMGPGYGGFGPAGFGPGMGYGDQGGFGVAVGPGIAAGLGEGFGMGPGFGGFGPAGFDGFDGTTGGMDGGVDGTGGDAGGGGDGGGGDGGGGDGGGGDG